MPGQKGTSHALFTFGALLEVCVSTVSLAVADVGHVTAQTANKGRKIILTSTNTGGETMTDSGNSGPGNWTTAERHAAAERARRPTLREAEPGTECKRCGRGTCRCQVYLAEAITNYTGVEHPEAAHLAEKVWADTAHARQGELAPVVPIARECSFCGQPVYRAPDGQIRTSKPGPNLELSDDPVCPNSPNQEHTHAMP